MAYSSAALKQLKENSSWYLILGICLMVFGVLAIAFSLTSTLLSVIYLGAALMVLGVFEGFKSFKVNKWSNFFLHAFLCILYIIGGLFIVMNPTLNAITLTLMLAIFFVIAGISRIVFALSQDVPHKGWILFSGIITLLLGILIWAQWPYSGLWVLGTFIGIDMIFTGITWVQLSLIAKNM